MKHLNSLPYLWDFDFVLVASIENKYYDYDDRRSYIKV